MTPSLSTTRLQNFANSQKLWNRTAKVCTFDARVAFFEKGRQFRWTGFYVFHQNLSHMELARSFP